MEEQIDRVIIKTVPGFCQLIIPTKKDWSAIYFSGFGVLFTSVFFIVLILSSFHIINASGSLGIYAFIPIILFIIITRIFLWNTIGKEVITINDGIMKIDRFWMFFFTPKLYELSSVRNLRTDFDDDSYDEYRWNSGGTWSSGRLSGEIKLGGTFIFDYRGDTIKFGDSVDKDDADLVLKRLKELKVFSVSNLSA